MGLSDKFAMMIKDHDKESNVDAKDDVKKAADDTKIATEEAVINEEKEKEEKDLIDAFSQTKI
jgi:hypothetical protein